MGISEGIVGDGQRRLHVARTLTIIGAAVHVLAPELTVLPQDPTGPTIGIEPSTWALRIIGIVALVGGLVVRRLPSLGRSLVALTAIMSVFSILWEFRAVVLLLAIPLVAAVWLFFVPAPGSTRAPTVESRRAAVGAIAVSGYLTWRMLSAYAERFTPTHDDSVAVKPNWLAAWLWVGGVTPTSAVVTAGGLAAGRYSLSYWADPQRQRTTEGIANPNGVARFELDELAPSTNYSYVVHEAAGGSAGYERATFRTPALGAQNVTIAFGSCASTGSNGAVFDAIRSTEPDVFVQLGDLHYGNLTSNRAGDHIHMLGRSLSTPAQSALYSSVPSAWIWDDHDFGPNDSDASSPGRGAALSAYRQAVPHWGVDPAPDKPIDQAFSIGRVRLVTTDTRSQRRGKLMISDDQETWLIDELTESARTHALVVWAMPTPWNFPAISGSDVWGGFPEQRRRIANALAEAGVTNLVMISGDWHLAAIDDGTNTGYADDGSPGFPLIHGAPLDRPGARTNDPYSHGVFSNAGQFGTVEVTDDGGASVQVVLCTHLWTGERLGELELTFGE